MDSPLDELETSNQDGDELNRERNDESNCDMEELAFLTDWDAENVGN